MVAATRLDLFTPEECSRIREEIHRLQPYWVQRHSRGSYYTLGASNYWDLIRKSHEEYRREAHRLNAILKDHLGFVYERLSAEFFRRAKVPIEYDPDLAMPGFHIFTGSDLLSQTQDAIHGQWFTDREDPNKLSNSIHCDTPHLFLDFGSRPIDKTDALSFTGAIALPKAGSGLYTWDMTLEQGQKIPEEKLLEVLRACDRTYHPYHIGELFLHPGMVYHQIAKLENVLPGEERITLQGHTSRRLTGEWVLYW